MTRLIEFCQGLLPCPYT